ncbi:hypothetical protein BCV72DRAFT_218116 [Rhizopus microsporus var. microsporus]|uniref:MYND-type domain-containing protein n=1 Tax=Rhizopus microsporus var. microsporus TaxID=86635 RepID=A0A1X0QMK6_RHIZD|nr:hypothetical protein BCV72DRAFT_218116 [Rhizopus microsporus var. microsporus]
MLSPKVLQSPSIESKTVLQPSYFSSNHYQYQLAVDAKRKYSVKDCIRLASQVNTKHDANGCYRCDLVASYYMTALKIAREQEPIICNQDLFQLVSEMINLILSHRETSKYQSLAWFDLLTAELWELAKQLKEESFENDLYIPMDELELEDEEEMFKRAIRTSIYHCRAVVCEQHKDVEQAIVYYRKCASVRPAVFESQQNMQKHALTSMRRLISSEVPSRPISTLKTRPTWSSTYSSDSASSSIRTLSTFICSNCSIEKQTMPVCAKCKIQPYCSIRCMKSHKSVHELTCSKS